MSAASDACRSRLRSSEPAAVALSGLIRRNWAVITRNNTASTKKKETKKNGQMKSTETD